MVLAAAQRLHVVRLRGGMQAFRGELDNLVAGLPIRHQSSRRAVMQASRRTAHFFHHLRRDLILEFDHEHVVDGHLGQLL